MSASGSVSVASAIALGAHVLASPRRKRVGTLSTRNRRRTSAASPLIQRAASSSAGALVSASLLSGPAAAQIADGNDLYYTSAAIINADIHGANVIIGKSPGFASPDADILTPYTVTIAPGAYIDYNYGGSPKRLSTALTPTITRPSTSQAAMSTSPMPTTPPSSI